MKNFDASASQSSLQNNPCGDFENSPILLRPHHGLCILSFTGHGYSEDFTNHMTSLVSMLRSCPETLVQIQKGCDFLCSHCPHRQSSKGADVCQSMNPALFDENVLRSTGFSYGQVLTWKAFSDKTSLLLSHHLEETCPGCEWLSFCRKFSKETHQGEKE